MSLIAVCQKNIFSHMRSASVRDTLLNPDQRTRWRQGVVTVLNRDRRSQVAASIQRDIRDISQNTPDENNL
jgi:hypothetical protein